MVTREQIETALDSLAFQAAKYQSWIATRRMNRQHKDMYATEIAKLNAARNAIAELFAIDLDASD